MYLLKGPLIKLVQESSWGEDPSILDGNCLRNLFHPSIHPSILTLYKFSLAQYKNQLQLI